MHEIRNSLLRVKAREYGAELISIFDVKRQNERLWQADPAYWGWHAPTLFPVVGRCLNDQIKVDGKYYPMEKHGFVRRSQFRLMDLTDTEMIFSLTYNDETFKSFPFRFEFLIRYRLNGHRLNVFYEVINKDDVPFSCALGGHPAFAVPVYPDEKYMDYYLEFNKTETTYRHYLNGEGFFNGEKELTLNHSNTINLMPDLFKEDALVFKDLKSDSVTLRSTLHDHYLKLKFSDFHYLGVWAKVNAPYVCLEPWIGCADSIHHEHEMKNREGVKEVLPGKHIIASYEIEVG